MKTLLLDLSNIAWATFHSTVQNDKSIFSKEDKMKLWKHYMLSSIVKIRSKHSPNEFVVCVDSTSWRYKYFPFYKARRAAKKSTVEYEYFKTGLTEFVTDLETYFPYKVVKVKWAEADDIIAVLTQELQDDRSNIVIASRDKDFKQLLRHNVQLWDTVEHKFKVCRNPKEYLVRHVLMGDAGDDVPNIRSDSDTFITDGKRQKPCGEKTVDKILQEGLETYVKREGLLKNFKRNRRLIMLKRSTIPERVWTAIVKEYESKPDKKGNYMQIVQYLGKNKLKKLGTMIDKLM